MLNLRKKHFSGIVLSLVGIISSVAIAQEDNDVNYVSTMHAADVFTIASKPTSLDVEFCTKEHPISIASLELNKKQLSISQSSEDVLFGEKEVTLVSVEELDEIRGTFTEITAETLGIALLEANLLNNSSSNGITGNNVVSDGAFGNSQGIVSLVQNSGNNVVIQSATVVNLTLSE